MLGRARPVRQPDIVHPSQYLAVVKTIEAGKDLRVRSIWAHLSPANDNLHSRFAKGKDSNYAET